MSSDGAQRYTSRKDSTIQRHLGQISAILAVDGLDHENSLGMPIPERHIERHSSTFTVPGTLRPTHGFKG